MTNKLIFIIFASFILVSGFLMSNKLNDNSEVKNNQKNLIKATILYDNYVFNENTRSDWGFSCLIEIGEETILFDTGTRKDIFFHNVNELNINLNSIDTIIISHNHGDHTGNLLNVLKKNSNVDVYLPHSTPVSFLKKIKDTGANVLTKKDFCKINKIIYLTGEMGTGIGEQSMILDVSNGLIVVTGCSHPGILNIVKKSKNELNKKIYMVFGGFHLMSHSKSEINNIINEFRKIGVKKVGATHCTGAKAINMFKSEYKDNYERMGTGKILKFKIK